MRAAGTAIWHLAFGESPFPVPDCFVKALRDHAHQSEYLPVEGTTCTRLPKHLLLSMSQSLWYLRFSRFD